MQTPRMSLLLRERRRGLGTALHGKGSDKVLNAMRQWTEIFKSGNDMFRNDTCW